MPIVCNIIGIVYWDDDDDDYGHGGGGGGNLAQAIFFRPMVI